MDILRIEILNPKAKKLLKSLVDLKLIAIRTSKNEFSELLKKLRSNNSDELTLEEISKEVEIVRSKRYGENKS